MAGSVTPGTKLRVRQLADADEVASAAAERFVEIAAAAVSKRGRFTVALAGGSTPRRLYERLAAPLFRDRVDWAKVEAFFGDERCVPPTHPDSNFRMCSESLLDHVPIPPEQIHRMAGEEPDRERAARLYQEKIAAIFDVVADGTPPSLDLVLLGMGDDGHTASLFPGTTALRERERWVAANHVPAKATYRLTFTAPLINGAQHVVFLVVGGGKARVLAEVLEGPMGPERMPAQLVRPAAGSVAWLVDASAGGLLKRFSR